MYISIFFIIIGFLVFTNTLVMTIWFKNNRVLNFYLIFNFLFFCFYLITHGLNNIKPIGILEYELGLNYYQIILILIPSTYLYFEKLITNTNYPVNKDFLYFILPILFIFYLGNEKFLLFFPEKVFVFILFIIYALFFCWKSYRILKPFLSNDFYDCDVLSAIVKNWAKFIFKMMVLVIIHFFIFFSSRFFNMGNIFNLIFEAGLLLLFLIGYFKIAFSPVLLYGSYKLEQISNISSDFFVNKVWILDFNKSINSTQDVKIYNSIKDKIPTYINQIENIALVNYSFRNLDYSIKALSVEIGLPKYYLEFIFKYYCKVSFNDYKKVVRVFDAVKLINEGFLSSNTLDALSRYVGFASYSPFLVNFKEIVGISPFEYYKKKVVILNKNAS